ncbi:hypothetical protein P153DRAFT_386313 [Dothidotthia symphoricarpi CBS 119687]|uniref:Uncharacterized protein n=1 Tax=Dothidotthia symphoricarpi CBS 119687 TaxID=1392245 RepID=A0A6A6ADC5_9PLEO|nr:uncharacterized protein P153DRAFT_386313 [Dothidotthia symphoricarpi CBS 119687]KAF2129125.1 hypothetical protein P153DRAFT_386313 [Dothidotthia symphoricarpi CBS 119687]
MADEAYHSDDEAPLPACFTLKDEPSDDEAPLPTPFILENEDASSPANDHTADTDNEQDTNEENTNDCDDTPLSPASVSDWSEPDSDDDPLAVSLEEAADRHFAAEVQARIEAEERPVRKAGAGGEIVRDGGGCEAETLDVEAPDTARIDEHQETSTGKLPQDMEEQLAQKLQAERPESDTGSDDSVSVSSSTQDREIADLEKKAETLGELMEYLRSNAPRLKDLQGVVIDDETSILD